jgi:predicted transcriptional regulator
MPNPIPDLSRFETQCLRILASLGEGSARDVLAALPDPPGYSTIRTILARLEEKGAVERVRVDGRAWIYRPRVSTGAVLRKEVRRFLDVFFEGRAKPLVAHLVEMDALSLDDLREAERVLGRPTSGRGRPGKEKRR